MRRQMNHPTARRFDRRGFAADGAALVEDGYPSVDWARPAEDIAVNVAPLRARLAGRTVTITRTRSGGTMSAYRAGTVTRCDDQVWVQAARGHVVIERVLVGAVEVDAAAHFRSLGVGPGDTFETAAGAGRAAAGGNDGDNRNGAWSHAA